MHKKKSLQPSVRALDELKSKLERDITSQTKLANTNSRNAIYTVEQEQHKSAVPVIVEALEQLDIPYDFVHKSHCQIIKNYSDYDLDIQLKFNPDKVQTLKSSLVKMNNNTKHEKELLDKLDIWYRKQLLRIANRQTIEEFKM